MGHLILCTSFSTRRRSGLLGAEVARRLRDQGESVEVLRLSDLDIPFCDGGAAYGLPQVAGLREAIMRADTITLAVPIHNYDAGGGARNAIAMGGDAWTGKTIGIVCAAGGDSSYMSVMSLANSLMLDYRCWIIPRFVYATGSAFEEGTIKDPQVLERLGDLARILLAVTPTARTLAGLLA